MSRQTIQSQNQSHHVTSLLQLLCCCYR